MGSPASTMNMDLHFFLAGNMSPDALGLWLALGSLLLLVVGVGLLLFFEWIREKLFGPRQTLKDVKKEIKLQDISEITEGLCRFQGKIQSIGPPLVSPWGQKACVYYHLEVFRRFFRKFTDYKNRTASWKSVWSPSSEARDTKHQSFMVSDGVGKIEIDLGSTGDIGKSSVYKAQIRGFREFETEVLEGVANWPKLKSYLQERTGSLIRATGRFEKWMCSKLRPLDEMEAHINEVPLPDNAKDLFLCRERVLEQGVVFEVFGHARREKGKLVVGSEKWPLTVRRVKESRPNEKTSPEKETAKDCPKCNGGQIRLWNNQERCWNCGHVVGGEVPPKISKKTTQLPVDVGVLKNRRISRALKHPLFRKILMVDFFLTLLPILSLGLTAVTVFLKIAVIIFLVLVVGCVAGLYHFFGPDDSKIPAKEPITLPVKGSSGVRGKDVNSTSGVFPGGGLPGMGGSLPGQGK